MNKQYQGIAYIILSAFCFAWMDVFIRLAGDVPTIQKVFFRNFFALLVAVGILLKNRDSFLPAGKGNLKWLLARAVGGTCGMLGNFYAVDRLNISDASMLNKMSPFFAILCSIFLLKEKLKPAQAAIVIGAFLGSLFIVKPSFANLLLVPSLAGLVGGFGAGFAYAVVRVLGERGERGEYIVFFFSLFSCTVTLPYLLLAFTPMAPMQFLSLIGCGVAASGGQFAITAAYFCAPAREISVYDYSQILFTALLGFLMFGQVPDQYSFLGYGIIIFMAVLMFWYNNRKQPA